MQSSVQPCIDLAAARKVWEQLNEEGTAEDLHQTFPGFWAWASSDKKARPLPLLAAYNGTRPMALLPVRPLSRHRGGIRLRVLETAGNDHWRLGMPVLGRDPQAGTAALLMGLSQLRGWDLLELGPMPESSKAAELLIAEGRRLGLRPQVAGRVEDPVVRISGSFQAYYAQRSGNLRSQVKRGENRLMREGPVQFEEYSGGDDLDKMLEEFFRIEASGWKGREGTAISTDLPTRRFYTRLAHQAAKRGSLRLYMLRVGGHCVAADYCLVHNRRVSMLKVGYDEAWAHCSPGQVMRKLVIEHLFQAGTDEVYDMMAGGGEHRGYKARWANQVQSGVILRLFNPQSVKGRLAAGASRLRAWLRPRRAAAPVALAESEAEAVHA